jgi:predicted nuclease with TOPRIM domain
MIDIRIATDPERAEILSKILKDSSFMDFGVSISSIIPTVNEVVVGKAATGADILLIATHEPGEKEVGYPSVGHVEYVVLPESDDAAVIKKALKEGVMKSAMQCMTILSTYKDMEEEVQQYRKKEQEYQEMREEYAELKEKEIYLEKVTEESKILKQKIRDLENELEVVKKRRHRYNGMEVKDLFSFPLDDLWKDIARTPPPRNEDIEVAVKRLSLEGSVMVSCGFLAAPSREEALDMLRIVKIALDLQKGTRH